MDNEEHDKMVSRMRGRPLTNLGFTVYCDPCEQRGETVAMSETVANDNFVTMGWRVNWKGDMLCPECSQNEGVN